MTIIATLCPKKDAFLVKKYLLTSIQARVVATNLPRGFSSAELSMHGLDVGQPSNIINVDRTSHELSYIMRMPVSSYIKNVQTFD